MVFGKATELGVARIIPIICQRTEKEQVKNERMNGILISALLQSQQAWLPELVAPVKMEQWLKNETFPQAAYIAHCLDDQHKKPLAQAIDNSCKEKSF
jgi:16S rRNA (uracil1498-N3)-methyltransferase